MMGNAQPSFSISQKTFYDAISWKENGKSDVFPIEISRKLGSTHYFTSVFWFFELKNKLEQEKIYSGCDYS
jgi:hypothetical protein